MTKSASEIIKEQGIQIKSSPSGGFKAVHPELGIVVQAATLEKLMKIIVRAFGEG